jgi:hypothetical protein
MATAPSYCVDGGGGNAESAAGCCVGGGGNGEEDDEDAGGGSGTAPGAGMVFSAVRLLVVALETRLWGICLWTGFDGGVACITTRTGLGTRVGGGFCQNEWSGCGPTVTCTVCGT